MKVYRLCVELLKPGSMRLTKEHHAMGTPGGAPVQSGDWRAYRVWINAHTPGYRLVYWKNSNNFLIMNVRAHDDYSIDPPFEES